MKQRQRKLEALLKAYVPEVPYDDQAGLARLRENVAKDTPAPAWEAQVPHPRRFVWWPLLLLAPVLFLAWPRAEVAKPVAPALPAPAPALTPTVEQLPAPVVARPTEPTPAAEPAAPRAERPRVRTTVRPKPLEVPHTVEAPSVAEPTPDLPVHDAPEVVTPTSPQDLLEMQEVARAERMLERNPGAALALLGESDERYPRGYFRTERSYLKILALVKLGRRDEARAAAWSFFQDHPRSAYRKRIEDALR